MKINPMRKYALIIILVLHVQAFISPAQAGTGLCEAAGHFTTDATADWTKEQNVSGVTWPIPNPPTGGSYQISCDCTTGTKVNLFYFLTNAITATGQLSGYYHLNDSLDIKTEISNIPGSTGPVLVPSKIGSPIKDSSGSYSTDSNRGVCKDDPPEKRLPNVSIGADTTFTLYVSKPFLGELIIPDTTIAYLQAAWSSSSTYPKTFKNIAELHIQGRITVPQSCKINQGDVIQVNLGVISAAYFTTKDAMPEHYTPVNFDIVYDCGDMSDIKNSLYMEIEASDLASQYVLIARRRETDNVPDVGIRLVDITNTNVNVPFNPGSILIDSSGHGVTHMEAYPVNLTGGVLSPGYFKGTATITVIVK
ncbi:fimbrial protein [Citrobacter amalonaticus]|uniref:fimbrial protein n=1 Tax=Citrobacter amalonaticus TaxID=35703 RepID=UPI000AE8EC34|nr:fimbrial protein [Citrobacter amalonaticus]